MISAEKIPNNVDLSCNKRLQRALEHWQPKYIQWWHDMGPQGFQDYHQVYLRTAISVDPDGWAHFEYVKLPEYRWGIFLADPVDDRHDRLRRLLRPAGVAGGARASSATSCGASIVTQGDTEPASVEQQRWLGHRCPSLYDLRNLFQVNVEEGRHLWAMVYLLHSYFGRDGRDEAEELLGAPERQPRQAAHPRRVQRADRQLARLLHVHDVHRPRRQVAAAVAVGELARSAVAHDALHADRGSAPHVRRRDRRRAHRRAHLPADEGGGLLRGRAAARRHRPADDPEVHQPLVLARASTCTATRSRPTPPPTSPTASRAAPKRPSGTTTASSRRPTSSRRCATASS